jgi:cytidylate kinase
MPVVTISRMFGAGGSEIAERVATEFGWPVFDNALVDAIAERSGLSRAEVSAQDEHVPSLVERIATALSLGSPESIAPVTDMPFDSPEERVAAVTRRVIEEVVQTGPAVFVGRGAQSLLAQREDAIHVFCYAPASYLRKYAMRELGLSAAEADRKVHEVNRQREQYVRRHFNRKWLAHENYHLCVNTGWLGIDRAAALVIDCVRERFGPGLRITT